MKLSDLFEEEREIWAKKIENPNDIGVFSWGVAEGKYRVGDVIFDNRDGLGAVGNNSNVMYMGFVALMEIDTFLNIAADHAGQREQTAKELTGLMKEGYPIAAPWLTINIDGFMDGKKKVPYCTGHEGRGRLIACKKYFNLSKVPVQIFCTGYRNRDMSEEVIAELQRGIKNEQGTRIISDAFLKVYK